MGLDTKKIGLITEEEISLALIRMGYAVLDPRGDDERYDFVADIKGKLIRIQAKTSQSTDGGQSFSFECRRVGYRNGKFRHSTYNHTDFDYFGTSWNGQCYLIPITECQRSKTLRIKQGRYAASKRTVWASDYELEKIVAEIEHELEEEDLNERTYQDQQEDNGLGVVV